MSELETPMAGWDIYDRTGSVVVGVDDTPAGRTAVKHAALEAELRQWDLRLLHVQPAGPALYSAGDRGARLLERMTGWVHTNAPSVMVSGHLAYGAAATVLLAETADTDMVVVGQRSGSDRTRFGLRIEERVAALHRGPALVVPVLDRSGEPGFADRPVVVGADDRPGPARALGFARVEARLRGCELVVLHATGGAPVLRDQRETPGGIPTRHRGIAGDLTEALVAASEQAAAVVIDRHGADGSADCVRGATCPVFVIG